MPDSSRITWAALLTAFVVLVVMFGQGCAGQVETARPAPDCLHDKGVVSIGAPERFDLSGQCTETADPAPGLNVGRRAWCCWQDQAPDISHLSEGSK